LRVAIGTHYDEIGAKISSLRQQKPPNVLPSRRNTSYFHTRTVTGQVSRDVCPRILTVTWVALMIGDQNLDGFGSRQDGQGVCGGPYGLAGGVPRHQDAANLGYFAARREQKDRPARAEDERLR
jgi:hypothetical protein